MAVQTVSVFLRAVFPDGRGVGDADFLDPLDVRADSTVLEIQCGRGPWQSALLTFSRRVLGDFASEEDPSESLSGAVQGDLQHLALWLQPRSAAVGLLKQRGLQVDVVVDLWIDQDQMDLILPPDFLSACARAGLSVVIVSND